MVPLHANIHNIQQTGTHYESSVLSFFQHEVTASSVGTNMLPHLFWNTLNL